MRSVLVVGASLAGLSAAQELRVRGFDGTVTVVDGAPSLPSDRPPLSKQVLAGTMEPDHATQPAAHRIDDLDLDLRFGRRATGLDLGGRELSLDDGSTIGFDGLVIATGATPRRLDTTLAGVHVLRTLEDCLAIKADLDAGPQRVVVIGAGFIGAEVAATCRSRGLDVTMIETAPLPLQRVVPSDIGQFVADLHGDEGVDVRLGVGVAAIEGGDRVERIRLEDGSVIDADVVVVGIGVVPETGWLEGSGLTLDNGVVCDETCLAAPGVVAAGDLARWTNPLYGESMRVEQWEHAIEQGEAAARRLLAGDGPGEPFGPVPWFWSDQFDRKIQMAGWVAPTDEAVVVDGSIAERRFVALFRRDDRCTAVLGVNRPRHAVQLRMAMAQPLSWDDALSRFS